MNLQQPRGLNKTFRTNLPIPSWNSDRDQSLLFLKPNLPRPGRVQRPGRRSRAPLIPNKISSAHHCRYCSTTMNGGPQPCGFLREVSITLRYRQQSEMIRMVSTPLRDPAKMGILRLLPLLLSLPHSATASWDYSTGDYVRTPSPFSIPTVVVRG
ncbi:hypothetical protein BO99DRAFT_236098 [Aspergillus violaceofuscus CBS 115571]|uniref:Uncharacterized protein n=1 Tax=Aspergillus violaceofuscus (strain CBS 115571) TaxID=1450538 RepID=A0A2V5GX38_ASPV1|nr:hypothetical protein BO99DRAFT_236098 [Aspergillus violaceofuscus CBS 115571]